MRFVTKLLVLAIFGVVSLATCLPAGAQLTCPTFAAPPLNSWGVPVAYGNFGNGIVTTDTWTAGTGAAVNTDSFGSSSAVPLGGLGCGFSPFGIGPFQTGFGGNLGTQSTQATGFSESTTFGLQQPQIVFGVPVPGPGGLLYT
jgi:hypothetical protein